MIFRLRTNWVKRLFAWLKLNSRLLDTSIPQLPIPPQTKMLISLTVGKVDAGVAVLLTEDKRLVRILLSPIGHSKSLINTPPLTSPSPIYRSNSPPSSSPPQ